MKKLIIFLFPFVFSISAFAQPESSFAENFSLIKHSRVANFTLVKTKISLLGTGIAAAENRKQNWGDRLDYKYGQLFGQENVISSEEKPESLAEGYLKRLATRSKKSRRTGGTAAIVVGGISLAVGAALLAAAEDEGGWESIGTGLGGLLLVSMGVAGVVGGTLALAIPSGAEREFDNVLQVSDRAQRERASAEALSILAARGRTGRILWGLLWSGFSAAALLTEGGEIEIAAYYGGFALYSFLRKSRAERAYASYLKEKEFQDRLEFRLGIMPRGGIKVGLVYSF